MAARDVLMTGNQALNQRMPKSMTRRMLEVGRYICIGKTNKMIAAELGLSIKTVEKHRQDIHSYIRPEQEGSILGVVRYFLQNDLITMAEFMDGKFAS